MPTFAVSAASHRYEATVARGALGRLAAAIPPRAGKLFVVTTADVWDLHGAAFTAALDGRPVHRILFAGGEENKRLAAVEAMAEEMAGAGGDRSSVVVAFGGGIVNDLGGFLAAIFMRGIPVIQVPTTLLAQVDAAVGGKTGANLVSGKNLIGAFHQPLAVLADPDLLATLPEREYRAGLFEVLKCGVIACAPLFERMEAAAAAVLARDPATVEYLIAESVRIKCEVVSADEREGGLRRILNFGHTVGHAIEAETAYTRYLHGEAVALGMHAATHLAELTGRLDGASAARIHATIDAYGPVPAPAGLSVEALFARLAKDKKTVAGAVHLVLPLRIGLVEVVSGVAEDAIREAVRRTVQ
jgi:3-dehydroquinate synthase